jgi:hypothetical protein
MHLPGAVECLLASCVFLYMSTVNSMQFGEASDVLSMVEPSCLS